MHAVIFLVYAILLPFGNGYDTTDLEIFDLMEEVGLNQTFYQVMEVTPDASTAAVRKAYRKLSLLHHPDKSKDENAEVKFRNLVSVYEVLKDTEKRNKYDQVLKDGLPDWRQPIYYYRKARKMGLRETLIVVFLIATVGHYLFKWAAYLEKKFELEELITPIKKRQEKKKAKGKGGELEDLNDTDSILEREFGYRRPQFMDLLPFVLYFSVVNFIRSLPEQCSRLKNKVKLVIEERERRKMEEQQLVEEQEQEPPEKTKVKRKPQAPVLRDASEYEDAEKARVLTAAELARAGSLNNDADDGSVKSGEWTEQDLSCLVKAIAKFPGGTPGRWERIAVEIGRPVHEVTKRMKEMKENIAASNSPAGHLSVSADMITKKRSVNLSDDLVTKMIDTQVNKTIVPNSFYMSQDDIPDDYDQGTDYMESEVDKEQYQNLRKRKVKRKGLPFDGVVQSNNQSKDEIPTVDKDQEVSEPAEESTDSGSVTEGNSHDFGGVWSQSQQKCLEAALNQFPKSVPDRWTCIARAVPGKTKDECLARYKTLVDHIKKKRTMAPIS